MNKQPSDARHDRLLQRRRDLVSGYIDDEVVMMSVDTGEYYGLNPVASRIWELLETPHTFEQLVDTMTREFDIDEQTCRKDVLKFLGRLEEKKLLIVTE